MLRQPFDSRFRSPFFLGQEVVGVVVHGDRWAEPNPQAKGENASDDALKTQSKQNALDSDPPPVFGFIGICDADRNDDRRLVRSFSFPPSDIRSAVVFLEVRQVFECGPCDSILDRHQP